MKKIYLALFVFNLLCLSMAQEFRTQLIFENDSTKNGGIPYRRGFAGMPSEPNMFFTNIKEDNAYFTMVISEIVYKYDLQNEQMNSLNLSNNIAIANAVLWNHLFIPMKNDIYVCIAADIFRIHYDFSKVIYADNSETNGTYPYNIHPIGSHVFYYDDNDQVRCVDLEGKNLSVQEAHKVLLSYNDALSSEKKAAMTDWHRSKLSGTGAIILGDRYYQSSLFEMFNYFRNAYGVNHFRNEENPQSKIFIGFDNDHVGYWLFNKTNEIRFIQGYDKQGKIVVTHNFVNELKLPYSDNILRFHLARESGNIYAMQSDADEGTIVYKMNHAWGKPNMLAIAINGMGTDAAYDEYVIETLSNFSKAELRLQRNHLFALKGYVFNSADLKAYFETQNWYESDPNVTSSVDNLTDAQKKLFDYIRELEEQ